MTVDFLLCSHILWFIVSNEPQERHCSAVVALVELSQGCNIFFAAVGASRKWRSPLSTGRCSVHLLPGHSAAQITTDQKQKKCFHSGSNPKVRPMEKNRCCCYKRIGPHPALPWLIPCSLRRRLQVIFLSRTLPDFLLTSKSKSAVNCNEDFIPDVIQVLDLASCRSCAKELWHFEKSWPKAFRESMFSVVELKVKRTSIFLHSETLNKCCWKKKKDTNTLGQAWNGSEKFKPSVVRCKEKKLFKGAIARLCSQGNTVTWKYGQGFPRHPICPSLPKYIWGYMIFLIIHQGIFTEM